MELAPFKTFQTSDYELSKSQGYTKEFASQLMKCPFLLGVSLSTTITIAGVTINHGLGKTPSGWFLTDNTDNAVIWRASWNATTITLDSSASSNIKLWVF